jgi:hypothetical protein
MAALGIEAESAIYADDVADQVREQLLHCGGVLVWVDPLSQGRDRVVLDALLRDVASNGVWVSTQPAVIPKMGVKEVLHRTRHLDWGTDTHLYPSGASRRRCRSGSRRCFPATAKPSRKPPNGPVWPAKACPAR